MYSASKYMVAGQKTGLLTNNILAILFFLRMMQIQTQRWDLPEKTVYLFLHPEELPIYLIIQTLFPQNMHHQCVWFFQIGPDSFYNQLLYLLLKKKSISIIPRQNRSMLDSYSSIFLEKQLYMPPAEPVTIFQVCQ